MKKILLTLILFFLPTLLLADSQTIYFLNHPITTREEIVSVFILMPVAFFMFFKPDPIINFLLKINSKEQTDDNASFVQVLLVGGAIVILILVWMMLTDLYNKQF